MKSTRKKIIANIGAGARLRGPFLAIGTTSALALALPSCGGGGDSSFGNILEETTGTTETTPVTCTIDSSLPSASGVKVASTAGTNTSFGISPNNAAECLVSWKLNGAAISGTTAFQNLGSSVFNAGANTLVATISNGTSQATKSWTVTKNIPPACGSQTPAAGGNSILHTATLALSGTLTNTDADTLSFTWKLGGAAAPTLFTGISSVGNQSSATFDPAFANVGLNQTVALEANDGYETGSCAWTVSVTDPNVLAINACLPDEDTGSVGNQVVLAGSGGASSKTLIVSNTGGANFVWKIDGSTVGGAATDSLNLTAGGVAVGNHTVVVEVTDANNLPSPAPTCSWALKRNSPPVLSGQSPTAPTTPVVQRYRMNYNTSQLFSANVADANSDAITYAWKLDGVTKATGTQAPGALTYSLAPAGNVAMLGPHTLTLEATDGTESATTLSWEIEINAFSVLCNQVMNTPVNTAAPNSTPVCTLAGSLGVGDGLSPTVDGQDKIRIVPGYFADDGAGNLFVSDLLNQAVWLYTVSGNAASYFGQTFAANKMHLIVGGGANGLTVNNLAAKNATKLNWPGSAQSADYVRRGGGIAFDPTADILYVSDWGNDRIVRIEPTTGGGTAGNATTIVGKVPGGGAAPANNTAGNTDSAPGTSHFCQNPAGLALTDVGGKRWLYMTCYTSHTIKRMNADPADATDDANGVYGDVFTVVGRMPTGVSAAGSVNGTLGVDGESYAYNPYAITADAAGNIYWTEWGRGRIRMATTSGNAMSVFAGRSTSVAQNVDNAAGISVYHSTFGTNAFRDPLSGSNKALRGDNTSPAIPSGCSGAACFAAVAAGGPNVAPSITGPNRILTNECTPMAVTIEENGFGSPTAVDFTVNLTNPTGAGAFYSDAACTSSITSVVVAAGTGRARYYFRTTANQSKNITAAVVGGASVNFAYTSSAGAAATRVTVHTPGAFYYQDCVRIVPQLVTTSDTPGTLAVDTTVTLATRGTGTFYSDAACTVPSPTATILAGRSTGELYYARTAHGEANMAIALVGRDDNGSYAAASTANGFAETGVIGMRLPAGLAVATNSVTGAVEEIYAGTERHHRVMFINASGATLNRGGQSVEPGDGVSAVGTGNTVFNGDNNQGNGPASDVTVVYNPAGLHFFGGQLLVADMNYRVRRFDYLGNQKVTTLLGNGVGRLGYSTDSAVDAPSAIMNAPSHLIVDSGNKIAYVADTFNGRIRRLNLSTGRFDTVVGNQYTGTAGVLGDAPVENALAISQKSSGYRAIALYNTTAPSANTFMLMTEQNNHAAGVTRASLVRAWNMAGPNSSLFGTSVTANYVSTIAGDFSSGSKAWATAPANADGANNSILTNLLFNPEGIATVGSKVYVSNYGDHTIVEFDPSNNSSRVVIGQSGVATVGAPDAQGTAAIIRYPTVITADTVSGNFFFADNTDQTAAKIRYVNTTTGMNLTVAGTSITDGSVASPQVQTVAPIATTSQIWGISVNSSLICYASGSGGGTYLGSSTQAVVPYFDGSTGAHNVVCIDRDDGTQKIRVGPAETGSFPYRAGAAFNNTDQENVPASSAKLASPVGLAFDPEGNLLIVEKGNGTIRLVRRWY